MQTPPLVSRAVAAAGAAGPPPEDGPLLHVLAGRRGVLRAALVGARSGVRAAWVASALDPGTPLLVVTRDEACARAIAAVFADDVNLRVLAGDWRSLLPGEAPFDLLVAEPEALGDGHDLVSLLAPGGTLVVVGLPAGADARDEEAPGWSDHPLLAVTQVLTAPASASFVGVRLR